jgi:hypothetical protein
VLNPPWYYGIKNYHKDRKASSLIKRKTLYIKIKDGKPFIKSTRQMRPQVNTTQKQKKTKTNNQQKIRKKKPYANKTQGYEMTINDDKEDLR